VLFLTAPAAADAAWRQLVVNGKPTLRIWVVNTPAARAQGVKGHPLSPGEGLWFAYPSDTATAFWMGGVHAPLVLAWIDRNHRVIGIRRMKPCPREDNSCELYYPPERFRWAVEVLPRDLGPSRLKVGSLVRLRPFAGSPSALPAGGGG
jgi:uncharacterized membrane protein (UPF0127 family)